MKLIFMAAAFSVSVQAAVEVAVVAAGCFWATEGIYEHVVGVTDVVSGYAAGTAEDADYQLVSSSKTNHTEVVAITFDNSRISYKQILDVFFYSAHDPTVTGFQVPDIGEHYRSAVFATEEQEAVATEALAQATEVFEALGFTVTTELLSLTTFPWYAAEDYHQDFVFHFPDYDYVATWDVPMVARLKKDFPALYTSVRLDGLIQQQTTGPVPDFPASVADAATMESLKASNAAYAAMVGSMAKRENRQPALKAQLVLLGIVTPKVRNLASLFAGRLSSPYGSLVGSGFGGGFGGLPYTGFGGGLSRFGVSAVSPRGIAGISGQRGRVSPGLRQFGRAPANLMGVAAKPAAVSAKAMSANSMAVNSMAANSMAAISMSSGPVNSMAANSMSSGR